MVLRLVVRKDDCSVCSNSNHSSSSRGAERRTGNSRQSVPRPFGVDLVGDGVLRKVVFIDVTNHVQCTQPESRKTTGVAYPAMHLKYLLIMAGDIEANPGTNCPGCTMKTRGDVIALTCSACHRKFRGLTSAQKTIQQSFVWIFTMGCLSYCRHLR